MNYAGQQENEPIQETSEGGNKRGYSIQQGVGDGGGGNGEKEFLERQFPLNQRTVSG